MAIQKLQGYLTNKLQLIHLQRDDAEKTYTMKPSAEQEKTLHDLDQQYTRHMQEASLLEHLHAHAVLEKENSDYLLHIYQIQAKQKKLQIKKIGSQIKKLLPAIKKLIANYP